MLLSAVALAAILFNADFAKRDGFGLPVGWDVVIGELTDVSYRTLGGGVIELSLAEGKGVHLRQGPIKLKSGGRYRFGAEVKTSGLGGADVRFGLWDFGWSKTLKTEAFPGDTRGGWRRVSWEGTVHENRREQGYSFAIIATDVPKGGAKVLIRNMAIEPLDDASAAAAAQVPDQFRTPMPVRIVPVSPRLLQFPAAGAPLVFYWPGRPEGGVASCRLSAAIDGGSPLIAPFGPDGRATVAVGKLAPGKHGLSVAVTDASGATLMTNAYSLVAVAPAPKGPKGRRLNNFVTELARMPLKNGTVKFFRAEPGWTWISAGRASDNPDARGFLDGSALPALHAYDGEPYLETMRHLPAGWHTLKLGGVTGGGTLRVHAGKAIFMRKGSFVDEPTRLKSIYLYNLPFRKRFIAGTVNTVNWKGLATMPAEEKAFYFERGIKLCEELRFGPVAPERDDREASYNVLNSAGWQQGCDLEIDENALGASMLSHVNTSENCWRLLGERPGQKLDTDWCDAPVHPFYMRWVHASEIAAIINSGNGTGRLIPECYTPVLKTAAESDVYIDRFAQFIARSIDYVPAARGSTVLYAATYIDHGDWCDYPCPEGDSKAMFSRMYHQFATRPDFADNAGTAQSGVWFGEEEVRRWVARCIRHYALEGGTNDLAAAYGYPWNPGFVANCDFADGLDGWTVSAAAAGGVVAEQLKGYGTGTQGRKKVPRGTGDGVATFRTTAAGVNRVSQRLKGLEPGACYSLMFVTVDPAALKTSPKENPPTAFSARLEGASEVPGLRFRHFRRFKTVLHRYVFKAESPEATLVLSDRGDNGEALAEGSRQSLNWIVFRKYYVENPDEVDEIVELLKDAN